MGLFLLPVGYLCFSILILCFVKSHDYPFLLNWYGHAWPEAFDVNTVASVCFTPEWYRFLVDHALSGVTVFALLLLFYLFCTRLVWQFFKQFLAEVKRVAGAMVSAYQYSSIVEKSILFLLFALIIIYRWYFFCVFPMHTDEICSYLFFSRPGPLIAITSYPIPNNHVFFNLVCSLISRIPFLSPKLVMRLPSMMGDLLLLYGIFCLFSRWKGFWRGIAVVAGVAFCYFTSYYAIQGRGYQWQELCALLSLIAGWNCFCRNEKNSRRGWPLFILASVFGFYINPVFLYHFLALALFLGYLLAIRKDVRSLFFLLRSLALIVISVAILYLPLILASSWKAFAENGYVTSKISLAELSADYHSFTFILKDGTYYGRAGMYFLLASIVISVLLYHYKRIEGRFYFYGLAYLVCVILSLTILILYQRMYPPERGLCYWILGINVVFVNIVYDLTLKLAHRKAALLIACFLGVKVAGSLRGLYWGRFAAGERKEVILYYKIRTDLAGLNGLKPVDWQVTNSDDFYPMYLREYLLEEGDEKKVIFNRHGAQAQVLFLPDAYKKGFDLHGYVLWGGNRVTAIGETPALKTLSIYVASGASQ